MDEERERDGEDGHELFMNVSMKGGKAMAGAARLSPGGTLSPKSILPC